MNRSVQWFASLVMLSAPLLAACAPTAAPVSTSNPTPEQRSVTGTVTNLVRSALPPNAVVNVQLVDVSLADAPARVLAEQKIEAQGKQPPFPFELLYETAAINPQHDYAVQARITADGQLLFINTQRFAVITKGNPTSNVEVIVEPAPASGVTGDRVTGNVTYFDRTALPPTAVVEVTLADVSRADAPVDVISTQQIQTQGKQVPFPFELKFDPAQIDPKRDYAVRARIMDGDKLLYISATRYAVITKGNPTSNVEVVVDSAKSTTPAPASSAVLTGTVTYLQRSALPPTAVVEVTLADVSRMDVPAVVISSQQIETQGGQVPFPFELKYDPTQIDPRMSYAVSARITDSGKLLFINTQNYAVLTRGAPLTDVEIMVQPVGSTAPTPAASAVLTGTVTYLQRSALPPTAVVEVTLADVSKADAPAAVISTQTFDANGKQVPFPYELTYDLAKIDPRFTYAVSARITDGGKLLFTSTQRYAVLTNGAPLTGVEIIVRPSP